MRILAAAAGLAMVMAGCGHQARSAPVTSKPEQPVATHVNQVIAAPVDPDPRVGAVFLSGSDLHACTGSVLHSAAGNLVLTAAHCLSTGGPARSFPGSPAKPRPTICGRWMRCIWIRDGWPTGIRWPTTRSRG